MSIITDGASSSTLEAQWLNSVSPEDFIRNSSTFNSLMMK